MNIDGDRIFTDEALLSRESALRRMTFAKRDAFTSHDAWRLFNEGVVRRHYMLQSSRLFLCDRCSPQRRSLSPCTKLQSVPSISMPTISNLRGTLDNLAWVLQYE